MVIKWRKEEKGGQGGEIILLVFLKKNSRIFIHISFCVCGWVCVWVYLSVCPVLPIAVDYPGDTEQSLQQPSAVNEQMESTAFPLNSLSLYWTWQRRLIIGLSCRYFWWLIPVLIKKRRRGDGVCWRGWLKCPHQQQRPTRSQWMVSEERVTAAQFNQNCRLCLIGLLSYLLSFSLNAFGILEFL